MPEPPQTGPEAIEYALSQLTAEEINNRGKKILATGSRSKRSYGVKLLNIARGLERNNLRPSDYMISSVPVIPPKYRPFAAQGDTLIPGDANVLYKDLIDVRDAHDDEEKMFGKQNAGASRLALYDAVKSVYGYGEAVKPKTRAKGVEGFLKKITGSTSKFSYVQSKMMAKTQDNVGRSTTIADPDLGIDEVGVPKDMAMTMYAPYVQRRLKGMGYKDAEALKAVKNRTDDAWRALQQECEVRPILYTRAPAWYRFNIVSGKVKLIDGSAIATNPIVQGSQSGDYDGNCIIGTSKLLLHCEKDSEMGQFIIAVTGGDFDELRQKKIIGAIDNNIELSYNGAVMKIIKDTKVVCRVADSIEITLPIASIPYKPETKRYDSHGAAVYNVLDGVKILTTAVDSKGTRWCPIETLTIEDGCSLRKVVTRKGREVTVSANESIAVFDPASGFTKIKPDDAMQGQLVPYIKKLPSTGAEGNFDLGWLLGMFLSDGTYNGKDLTLSKRSSSIRENFILRLKAIGGDEEKIGEYLRTYREFHDAKTNCGIGGESVKLAINHTVIPTEFKELLEQCYPEDLDRSQCNAANRSCLYKKLPSTVKNWSNESLLGLLCGLLVGDGTLSINSSKSKAQLMVNICTSSSDLRDGVLYIGKRLGIGMNVSVTKPSAGRVQKHDSYTITLSTPDLKQYRKQLRLDPQYDVHIAMLKHVTDNPHDVTPVASCMFEVIQKLTAEELAQFGLVPGGVTSAWSKSRKNPLQYVGMMRAKACGYISACNYVFEKHPEFFTSQEDKAKIATAMLHCYNAAYDTTTGWEYVKSVTEVPTETVYDVSVPETKVFAIENGLVIYDTVNLHVPASDEAVEEAWKLLLPSHDPFSDRDTDKIVLLPKQEQILGNYTAATSPNTVTYDFDTEEEALKAIKQGQIPLSANVQIRGGVKMASQKENEEVMQVKGPVRDPKTGKWMPTKNKNETEVQPDVAPVEKRASKRHWFDVWKSWDVTKRREVMKATLGEERIYNINFNAETPEELGPMARPVGSAMMMYRRHRND